MVAYPSNQNSQSAAPRGAFGRVRKGAVAMLASLAGMACLMCVCGFRSAQHDEPARSSQTVGELTVDIDRLLPGLRDDVNETRRLLCRRRDNAVSASVVTLRGNPFHGAKLPGDATAAADRGGHKNERAAVLKSLESLQLQSIVPGGIRRVCMINYVMFKEGELVDGFTIEQISAESVVVRNGSYRFELRVQR